MNVEEDAGRKIDPLVTDLLEMTRVLAALMVMVSGVNREAAEPADFEAEEATLEIVAAAVTAAASVRVETAFDLEATEKVVFDPVVVVAAGLEVSESVVVSVVIEATALAVVIAVEEGLVEGSTKAVIGEVIEAIGPVIAVIVQEERIAGVAPATVAAVKVAAKEAVVGAMPDVKAAEVSVAVIERAEVGPVEAGMEVKVEVFVVIEEMEAQALVSAELNRGMCVRLLDTSLCN